MNLLHIIRGILNLQRDIDVKKLPSQGLFYKDNFQISIKRAEMEDIIEYEHKYNREDLASVIQRLKKIVQKNCILTNGYTYNDIKSIDIVFIFLEIVKFTKGKPINIQYYDNLSGSEETVNFDNTTFNYFELSESIMKKWDKFTKEFVFEGYKYSVPCIGVENSLNSFLLSKTMEPGADIFTTFSYDFLYFLGHKSELKPKEIENLIQIFNFDMEASEQKKIRKIIQKMSVIGRYSLKKDSQIIDVTAKIDLGTIWK